jgi:hypothetical protein
VLDDVSAGVAVLGGAPWGEGVWGPVGQDWSGTKVGSDRIVTVPPGSGSSSTRAECDSRVAWLVWITRVEVFDQGVVVLEFGCRDPRSI